MNKKYKCNKCMYFTARKTDFIRHCDTNKHNKNIKNKKYPKNDTKYLKNDTRYPKKDTNKIAIYCKYCNKQFAFINNKYRHYKICKIKLEEDKIIKFDKLKKKIDTLEEELGNLKNNLTNKIINSNNNINMKYIINNYNNVKNYDEIMNVPLTEDEVKSLIELGAEYVPNDIIENRCIKNVSAENRSIHCLDISRDKFIIRKNGKWFIDDKGKKIIDSVIPIIQQLFIENGHADVLKAIGNNDLKLMEKIIMNQKVACEIISHKNDKCILDKVKGQVFTKNIIETIKE